MKKLNILLVFLTFNAFSQVKERNILMNKYSLDFITQNLIPHDQYKPYPRTPEEWKKVLTEAQIKEIIALGENAEATPILEITASMAMDFVRSGDRERHGQASYGCRNLLAQLIIAENVEGKDRFMEKIFNLAAANGTPFFYLRQPEDTIKGQMYYDLGFNDWVFEIDNTSGKQIADSLREVWKDYGKAKSKLKVSMDKVAGIYKKRTANVKKILT